MDFYRDREFDKIKMMGKINWNKVKDRFEEEMLDKLNGLPGHREVPEELREFRNIISHELPETAPKALFRKLIRLLLSEKKIDIQEVKRVYLEPELEKERQILKQYKPELNKLKQSARRWVSKNLPEETLRKEWKNHKTWLPRRNMTYKNQHSFQEIAVDTIIRYHLVTRRYR